MFCCCRKNTSQKGLKLDTRTRKRVHSGLNLPAARDVEIVKREITQCLIEYPLQRINVDNIILIMLKPSLE